MRIALVSHVARPSGAEIVLERLAAELVREHEVHVLFFEDGPMVERLTRMGARVEVLGISRALVEVRRDRGWLPGVSMLRAVVAVRRHLRAMRPDIVHTHSLKAALVAGLAARSLRLPFVWHVHDRITEDYLSRSAVALVKTALRVLPDAVAANSQATLATFASRGVRAVVPNPVPRPPDGFRPRAGRRGTPMSFGLVGRITAWKGQDIFLRAFAAAFPDGPQQAVLVGDAMFGESAFASEISALIDELGLSERTTLRGFRDTVWDELAALDVLVHASRIPEPFGLVVVEGVLAGLPVIAADAGGPHEYLQAVPGARLVTPADVGALREAMVQCDGSPADTAGVDALAAMFSPAAAASAVVGLYDQVARPGTQDRRRPA